MKCRKDALCLCRNPGLCGLHRGLTKNWKCLEDNLQIVIFLNQLLQRGKDPFAIAAIIITEFIDHRGGIRIAQKRVTFIILQGAQSHLHRGI